MKIDTTNDFLIILNQQDESAFHVLDTFFNNHSFPYLDDRTYYELSTDFGATKPLRSVWVKHCNFSAPKFVDFYEDLYQYRKVPRYENFVITVLITIIGGLLVNFLYDGFREWRKENAENVSIYDTFSKNSKVLLEYIIHSLAIREAYYFGKVTIEQYGIIIKRIKEKIVYSQEQLDEIDIGTFAFNILAQFKEAHRITSVNNIVSELKDLVKTSKDKNATLNSKEKQKINYRPNDIKIDAIFLTEGSACGILKLVKTMEDAEFINEGDIGWFDYYVPDMLEAMKKCAGSIAKRGGRTSHQAIVSRTLGKPCVCYSGNELIQGQVIYINGSENGDSYIIPITDTIQLKRYFGTT